MDMNVATHRQDTRLQGSADLRHADAKWSPDMASSGTNRTPGESFPHSSPRKAFLSHASELAAFPEGHTFAEAALDAVRQADYVAVDMRDFTARPHSPTRLDTEQLGQCSVYIGLLGLRYGSPARDFPGRSYTELEYETATAAGIPRLVFLLSEDAVLPGKAVRDPEYGKRQEEFRRRVLEEPDLTCRYFETPDELHRVLLEALRGLDQESRCPDPGTVHSSEAVLVAQKRAYLQQAAADPP
jgi:hypothetical protein